MKVDVSQLASIIPDMTAEQVNVVALTMLSVILSLKRDETLEFEFFKVTKLDDYGLFLIDYDIRDLSKRLFELKSKSSDVDPELESILDNLLENWRADNGEGEEETQ